MTIKAMKVISCYCEVETSSGYLSQVKQTKKGYRKKETIKIWPLKTLKFGHILFSLVDCITIVVYSQFITSVGVFDLKAIIYTFIP